MALKITQLSTLKYPISQNEVLPIVQNGRTAKATLSDLRGLRVASVKDFGAKGNNKADDTAAIQRALDTGQPVFFPAGVYRVSNVLDQTKSSAPAIYSNSKDAVIVQHNNNQSVFRVSRHLYMEGLTLTRPQQVSSSNKGAYGLELLDVNWSTFRNLSLLNHYIAFGQSDDTLPHFTGTKVKNTFFSNTIDGLEISGFVKHGIFMDATNAGNTGSSYSNVSIHLGDGKKPIGAPIYLRKTAESIFNQLTIDGGDLSTCIECNLQGHAVINGLTTINGRAVGDKGNFLKLGEDSSCIINHWTIGGWTIQPATRWYLVNLRGDHTCAVINGVVEQPANTVGRDKWWLAWTEGKARSNCRIWGSSANTPNLVTSAKVQAGLRSADNKLILKRWGDQVHYYEQNGRKRLSGLAIPKAGNYNQGDIVWNANPTAGGAIGWTCVASGSPGRWKSFGAIAR